MKIDPKAREMLSNFLADYENAFVRVGQIATGGG